MERLWATLLVMVFFAPGAVWAAKPPPKAPATPAPEIYSVKIDYASMVLVIEGINLDPATVSVTLAGVAVVLDPSSTDNTLIVEASADLASTVDGAGTYSLALVNNGGSSSISVFIPFALVYLPPGPDLCPCQADWEYYASQASPAGYAGLEPYCMVDSAGSDYVTVQFWDVSVNNYWVLNTDWSSGSGSCAQWLDGPTRTLDSQEEFDACANYLRSQYIEVYPSTGNDCLF